MGKGVSAEFVQLGGTKLNEPVPYRVILDRMSHEVPYYAVYLKMAALQGTYCINNTFWRTADDKFFGYAAAEKLGIAEPKTVVLPNRDYVDDVTAESLRNLWPTDFAMYLDYVGAALHHEAGLRRRLEGRPQDPHASTSCCTTTTRSGTKTMMLQEFITWDTYIRVPTIGRRYARAIRYDPGARRHGRLQPGLRHPAARAARQGRGAVAALQPGARLRHERARVRGQGRPLLRHRPHELHARPRLPQPEGRPLPLGGREDGRVRGREGALGGADARRRRTGRACC